MLEAAEFLAPVSI